MANHVSAWYNRHGYSANLLNRRPSSIWIDSYNGHQYFKVATDAILQCPSWPPIKSTLTLFIIRSRMLFYFLFCTHSIYIHDVYRAHIYLQGACHVGHKQSRTYKIIGVLYFIFNID